MATNPQVMRAVNAALMSTGAVTAALQTPEVMAQDAELEQIVVTGSRIRRVDAETASPVFTLDRSTIAETGISTVGDLLQQIPSISGAATNPQVNNGGGTGAAAVELRGLGTQRTLVLLNGRRMGNFENANQGVNVNVIPTNLIERVEVLKEGAGALYGSDAVGGVVNFVTRTDFDGLEVGYEHGVSSRGDGDMDTVDVAWGAEGERGGIMLSGTYQKQDEISSGDRSYTKEAIYFYVYVFPGGSSRAPTGRIRIPFENPLWGQQYDGCGNDPTNPDEQVTISVTRIAGTSGASPSDYRCFTSGDLYNYQPFNLVLTPQERASFFTQANFEINEYIEAYAELLHNYTTSGFQIAPLPLDARSDTIVIPADNVYNPFGENFGAGGDDVFTQAQWRLEGLGNRFSKSDTRTDHIVLGMRGDLPFAKTWSWDLAGTYSAVDQDTRTDGYLFRPLLAPAFGPNFVDENGVVQCGTPTAPIAGCIPINPFNLETEQSIEGLRRISAGYNSNYSYAQQNVGLHFTGDVFDLPAGALKAAFGYEFMDQDGSYDTDFNTQAQPPTYNVCQLSNETCSGDSSGSYDVNSLYGELFIPVLKDLPGAQAVNLTAGVRYSDYSTFGDSTDATFKVEWRPVSDLLVRGSFADVFRVPTIYDLYAAPASSASQFNDPCVGLTQAQLDANPNYALACENVVANGNFEQDNSQVDGLLLSNPGLVPETGEVLTYGFVYDPSWLSGLSLNVDFWDYSLEDVIIQLDVNTIADQCVATGDAELCGLISRFDDGSIFQIRQPAANFGSVETSGIDFGVKYTMRSTPVGDFRFAVDATYIDKYDVVVIEGADTIEVGGTFDRQFGNYAKWRGVASVGWALEPLTALVSARYIHSLDLTDPDGQPGVQPSLPIDSITYLDLSVGYEFWEGFMARFSADNITNEKPPLLYQNNVLNSNTDVSTYDLIGTYFRLSLSYKF